MSYDTLVGRNAQLTVSFLGTAGAWLSLPSKAAHSDAATILLPRSEVPSGTEPGDEIEVFVHLDATSRPIATTSKTKLQRGEVAFLVATGVTGFGAFFDWGLPKELLVPRAEQICDVRPGDRHPIGLYIDDVGRLTGTMRVSEMLSAAQDFTAGEWVEGEAWRKEPGLGVFVIVERHCVGLLPEQEPHTLMRGEAARFRIAKVLADGKIELSLRGPAHEEFERDVERVLQTLARPGVPPVGDRSSPELIRTLFGLSKKAFKRAVGHMLKTGAVELNQAGNVVTRRGKPGAPQP